MSCPDQSYIFKNEATSSEGWKTEVGNTTKRGISMNDIRKFLEDHEDAQSINASDLSLSNLFAIAQNLGVNLRSIYDFLEPHNMVEFLGANFINNTAPSISLNGSASITIPRSWNNGTGYIYTIDGQDVRGAFFKPVWTIPNGYQCIGWENNYCNSKYANNYLNRIMGISLWTEDGRMLPIAAVLPEYSDYTSNAVFGQYGPQLYGGAPTYPTGGWAKSGNNLIVHTREIWDWDGTFVFPICNDDLDRSFSGSGCSSTIVNYFSNVTNTGSWCNVDCVTDEKRQPYGDWQFRMQEVDNNGNNIPSTQTPFLYDLYDIGSGGSYIYQDPGVTVSDPDEGDISSRTRTIVYFYDTHNILGQGSSYSVLIHLHGWYVEESVLYESPTSDYTHFENRSIDINFNQSYWTSVWEFYYNRNADSPIQWMDGTIPGRYLFEYTVYDQCGEEASIEREVIVPLS